MALSPWPFGSNEPGYEYLLTLGVFLLTALWGGYAAAVRRLTFRPDAVSVGLAGLVLLSAAQLLPLPEAAVGVLSPARLAAHRDLIPAVTETLPGGSGGVARSTWLPLTTDAAATRTFLARCLGLLLLYAAVRNWLATRASLTRFAVLLAAVGLPLALLSLLDLFAGEPGYMLWVFPVAPSTSSTYGPFICRNHYPDFAYFALGLTAALAWPRAADGHPPDAHTAGPVWLTPRLLALTAAAVLVALSVPFSLSRGGVIAGVAAAAAAWLLARTRPPKEIYEPPATAARLVLAGLLAAVLLAAAWLGIGVVEARFATLADSQAAASRLPLWADAARLVPQFWATGSGDGTFVYVEGTTRHPSTSGALVYFENAHNEYLEALIEGGVVRLGLTLLLAGGALVVVGRGYRERHHRSVGPYLLGVWFGLAALALHAVFDFGIHIPAVAVVAAVAAGLGMAAAVDPGFVPARVRVRRVRSADAVATEVEPDAPVELPTAPRDPAWHARGVGALAAGLALSLAALAVVADAHRRAAAARLQREAEAKFWDADPDRLKARAALYAERARLLPGDGAAMLDAGQAALDAAARATWTPGAAVAGGPLGFLRPPPIPPESVVRGPLRDGLAWLQLARAANPLQPRVHARLAVHARFLGGEPAAAHFARAKALLPSDPDIWYASGREALARGDLPAATADFTHSLSASPKHVAAVVAALRPRLTPDAMRAAIPRDPAVLLAAVGELYPDRLTQSAERAPYLREAVAAAEASTDLTPRQIAGLAESYEALGRPDDAAAVMLRLYAARPADPEVLDVYAHYLEGADRFDEAVPVLEDLRRRRPRDGGVLDRIEAARHAARLIAEIRGG